MDLQGHRGCFFISLFVLQWVDTSEPAATDYFSLNCLLTLWYQLDEVSSFVIFIFTILFYFILHRCIWFLHFLITIKFRTIKTYALVLLLGTAQLFLQPYLWMDLLSISGLRISFMVLHMHLFMEEHFSFSHYIILSFGSFHDTIFWYYWLGWCTRIVLLWQIIYYFFWVCVTTKVLELDLYLQGHRHYYKTKSMLRCRHNLVLPTLGIYFISRSYILLPVGVAVQLLDSLKLFDHGNVSVAIHSTPCLVLTILGLLWYIMHSESMGRQIILANILVLAHAIIDFTSGSEWWFPFIDTWDILLLFFWTFSRTFPLRAWEL